MLNKLIRKLNKQPQTENLSAEGIGWLIVQIDLRRASPAPYHQDRMVLRVGLSLRDNAIPGPVGDKVFWQDARPGEVEELDVQHFPAPISS